MNRICIEKSTNKLIEFQSDKAPLGTLIQNAINAGYSENDIEEKYTDKDITTILAEQETPEEIEAREKEQMIKEEMTAIIRQQAIDSLKGNGKLPPGFIDPK